MENDFWNKCYAENEGVYGLEPNPFFKQFIDTQKPGCLLLPAEGEGRNAVYAASKGWQVDAFDFSEVAKEKALQLAKERGVAINYNIMRIEDYKAVKKYDAVGLIYVHLAPVLRKNFHHEVYQSLQEGGYVVLEAFQKPSWASLPAVLKRLICFMILLRLLKIFSFYNCLFANKKNCC